MWLAFSLIVFAWSLDIDLQSCEAWVLLHNNILFWQNLQRIWQTFWRFQHAQDMSHSFHFACVLNHHLLIRFSSFLVTINPLYNSFSIIGNLLSHVVLIVKSVFVSVSAHHSVSYLLSIYFKFIRSLIDIFLIIIVITNNLKVKLLSTVFIHWNTTCFLVDCNVWVSNSVHFIFALHSPKRLKYIR